MCWIVSDLLGQQGTQLVAQNNVNIQAAQQTRTEESKNQIKAGMWALQQVTGHKEVRLA